MSQQRSRKRFSFGERTSRTVRLWRSRADWRQSLHNGASWFRGVLMVIVGSYGLVQLAPEESKFPKLNDELIWFFFLLVGGSYLIEAIVELVAFFLIYREGRPVLPISSPISTPSSAVSALAARWRDSEPTLFGDCIEVERHPFLDRYLPDNGWPASSITIEEIEDSTRPKDMRVVTPLIEHEENYRKYWLLSNSLSVADQSEKLHIKVTRSDWNEIRTAFQTVSRDDGLRTELSSLSPREHRIPNSLCLHMLVEFSDGSVLSLHRRPGIAFYPGAFSFSAEEQLAEEDIKHGPTAAMDAWFKRALCEEVFPLTALYSRDPLGAWRRVADHVLEPRVWSIIFEEPSASFAIFALIQLRLTPSEYANTCRQISSETGNSIDNEGRLYFVIHKELRQLVATGHCQARAIFSDHALLVDKLHPTSACRVLKYLASKGI